MVQFSLLPRPENAEIVQGSVCVWGGAGCSYFKAVVDVFGREMHNVMVVVGK